MPNTATRVFTRKRSTLAFYATVVFGLALLPSGANAQNHHKGKGEHGAGHAQHHDWYLKLHDKNGKSCCSNQDCRPTSDRIQNGKVQVIIDGEWIDVPKDKILPKPSPDLGTHVCAPYQPNASYPKGHIFCVILGAGA